MATCQCPGLAGQLPGGPVTADRSRDGESHSIRLAPGARAPELVTAFYVYNGKNLPLWDWLPSAAYWALPRS